MEKQAEQVEEKKVEEEKTDSPASLRVVKEQDAASEETEEKKDKENDMEKNDSDEKKNYLEEMSRLDAEEEQLKLEQEKKASEKRRLAENLVKELEQKNKEILALNSKLKEEIKNNVEKMRQNEAMIKEQVEKEVAAKNEELLKANAGIQERIEKNLAQLKENESLKNNAERSSGAKPLSLRPVHNPLEIDADESVLSSLVKKASNYMAPLSLSTSNIVRGPQSGLERSGSGALSPRKSPRPGFAPTPPGTTSSSSGVAIPKLDKVLNLREHDEEDDKIPESLLEMSAIRPLNVRPPKTSPRQLHIPKRDQGCLFLFFCAKDLSQPNVMLLRHGGSIEDVAEWISQNTKNATVKSILEKSDVSLDGLNAEKITKHANDSECDLKLFKANEIEI